MIQCVSTARVDLAKLDAIKEAGEKIAACAREERGNISYDIVQCVDDPAVLLITERWETMEDFQAHVATADQPGDAVYEFGQVFDPACLEKPSFHIGSVIV